ncbi:hypothetical protein CTEN210_17813 [Chaetoceros tenuissimus]|uniref:G-protein coupled receptors family 1 profile domain-containing protein n=1 Tax=Chaetoceros tenuissimus TaxID=426638 RepID=A0AAD3HEW0_9STRA|nr:hypothetical protein CTEN210_17813 [Chaetoceros tenuissimus]
MSSLSLSTFRDATIARSVLSCVSLIASGTIIWMIKTEPKTGLRSPYSRIIFGLSVADIFFSLGMLLSPFLSPPDYVERPAFSMGTIKTCAYAGYLFIVGMASVPSYTLFLTYYFMRRVKYRVPQNVFAQKEEKWGHAGIIALAILFPTIALFRKEINPTTREGIMCFIASYPLDCASDNEIECERGEHADIYGGIFGAAGGMVFICLLVVLAMFTHHVYSIEKHFTYSKKEDSQSNKTPKKDHNFIRKSEDSNDASNKNDDSLEEVSLESSDLTGRATEQNNQDKVENNTKKTLSRQALNQSLLYIVAFLLIYMPGMFQLVFKMAGFDRITDSGFFFWWVSFFYPIGGVLNILIYTRPKVQKLQDQVPGLPWVPAFMVVIWSGGEVPSLADLGFVRRPDSVTTGPREENFDEHYPENYVDNDEQEYYEKAKAQLEVDLNNVPSFFQSYLSYESRNDANFNGVGRREHSEWKSSIGPSQFNESSNFDDMSYGSNEA